MNLDITEHHEKKNISLKNTKEIGISYFKEIYNIACSSVY